MKNVSIDKLKTKLQGSRGAELYNPNRELSIYITKLLLPTKITAVQITQFSLFLALIGTVLLVLPGNIYPLIGIFLFYLYAVLDSVDGEIARFRRTSSVYGAYVDAITHPITRPLPFIGVTLWLFQFYDSYWYLILGIYLTYIIHFSQLVLLERDEKLNRIKKSKNTDSDRVQGYRMIMSKLGYRKGNDNEYINSLVWFMAYIMQEWGAVVTLLIASALDVVFFNILQISLPFPFKLLHVVFYTVSFTVLYSVDYVLSYKIVKSAETRSK